MNKTSILLSFLMLFFLSCKNDSKIEKDIKELVGREIVFPEDGQVITRGEHSTFDVLTHKKIKVVSYFDYFECTSCNIDLIDMANSKIKELDNNVTFLGIIYNKDEKSIHKMFDTLNISAPILYYNTEIFGKKNDLKDRTTSCKTFLLDENNKIVLVGEPFNNKKLETLYRKHIAELRRKEVMDK